MRVLHVAECIGGVDRYLRNLLKYSNSEDIMILSQLYKKEDYEQLSNHVEIMQMQHGMKLSALREAWELRKKIRKHNPDIVYAHSSTAGAIVRMACFGLGVKVLYNPHGWSFNMEGRRKKLFIALERIMAHFCDAIVCISDAEKESALREKICDERKLHVVYNGIDIEGYKLDSTEIIQIPQDAFVVGMVGRISRQKAPDVFVKMAGEVRKSIPNSYFIIVGDVIEGDIQEKRDIENLARMLGVNLLITGWIDNPLTYMNRFNVGCLFSRWEGFGLAIPEYMLTGTPIVATKVDAIPYLITHGVNGLLVEKDDWKTASEQVLRLAKDECLRNQLIINGRETVKTKFDAKRVSRESEELYEVLIK